MNSANQLTCSVFPINWMNANNWKKLGVRAIWLLWSTACHPLRTFCTMPKSCRKKLYCGASSMRLRKLSRLAIVKPTTWKNCSMKLSKNFFPFRKNTSNKISFRFVQFWNPLSIALMNYIVMATNFAACQLALLIWTTFWQDCKNQTW